MSLRNIILSICLAVILGGCSSLSRDQVNEAMISKLASIKLVTPPGRTGQIYAQHLRQNLFDSYSTEAQYHLTSTISVSSSETFSVRGVSSDFRKMTMTVAFALTDIDHGTKLFQHTISASATSGTVSSKFGIVQSELQAKTRLAKLLAERVRRRIQFYFLTTAGT